MGTSIATARALIATAGHAVAPRAGAVAAGAGIVGAIVFAKGGMRMHDLTQMIHTLTGARLMLWGAWLAFATSAVAPAFDAQGTRMLRSLVASRNMLNTSLVALLVIVQAPWLVLFARGESLVEALGVALVAVAIETGLLAAQRSRVALACAAAGCTLAFGNAPPILLFLAGAPLAWLATRAAWSVALEQRASMRLVRRTHPVLALATAYVARMVRVARARLQAAAMIMGAGAGALSLTLRNDPDARPIQRTLVVLSLPLSVACALLAAPAIETEANLRPISRVARTTSLTLFLATALAIGAPSTAFAATAGAVASFASPAPPSIALAAAAWAIVIAGAVTVHARRAATRASSTSRFVAGVVLIAILSTALAGTC